MGFMRGSCFFRLTLTLLLTGGAWWLAASRGGQSVWFLTWLLLGVSLSSVTVILFNLLQVRVNRSVVRETVGAGEELAVELAVRHLSLLPVLWLSVSDRFARESDGQMFTVTKLVFPGLRRQFKVNYYISGLTRGEYSFVGTELVAGDWWGLAAKRRLLPAVGGFAVLPRPRPMLASVLPAGRGAEESGELFHFGPQAIGHSVRSYVNGDPLHRIHWRSTARTGQLMSRVTEPAEELRHMICLDGYRTAYGGPEGSGLFEQGIEWAAGMMEAAAETRCHTGLAVNGSRPLWLPPSLLTDSASVLRQLAGVSPDGLEPLAKLLLGQVQHQISPSFAVIVITPWIGADTLRAVCKLRSEGREVLFCHLTGNRQLTSAEREQHRTMELAGCRMMTARDSRTERAVRLDAEYEGA